MITLDDLTPRQCVLADLLWACDTDADVDRFLAGMPTKALRQEAESVLELMRLAMLDNRANDSIDLSRYY